MGAEVSWAREHKLGVAGLTAGIAGWAVLRSLDAVAKSVCTYGRLSFWACLLLSVASLGTLVWAAIKDTWWWVIAALLAALLLLSVLGAFEGC